MQKGAELVGMLRQRAVWDLKTCLVNEESMDGAHSSWATLSCLDRSICLERQECHVTALFTEVQLEPE